MRIVQETVADKLDDLMPLLVEHWNEIARNKQVMLLKPDVERYRLAEEACLVLALLAYDGEELVGYSINFIGNHLHYADMRYVSNDVLFVRHDYRNSRLGLQLIRATERAAKEQGAALMLWHAKEQTALVGIMPRLGYAVQDIVYSKEI